MIDVKHVNKKTKKEKGKLIDKEQRERGSIGKETFLIWYHFIGGF